MMCSFRFRGRFLFFRCFYWSSKGHFKKFASNLIILMLRVRLLILLLHLRLWLIKSKVVSGLVLLLLMILIESSKKVFCWYTLVLILHTFFDSICKRVIIIFLCYFVKFSNREIKVVLFISFIFLWLYHLILVLGCKII